MFALSSLRDIFVASHVTPESLKHYVTTLFEDVFSMVLRRKTGLQLDAIGYRIMNGVMFEISLILLL